MGAMAAGKKGTVQAATAVDRVVLALRQAMFDGAVKPGTHLREKQLSEQFAVSRSTGREAARVLTQDGLLRREPNRSVVVRHLSVAEVEDIFRARRLLEGACVRNAATCPDQDLQGLARALEVYVAAVRTDDHPRAAMAHTDFHASMVEILSRSQWLALVERSLLNHLVLILAAFHTKSDELAYEIEMHKELVDLCMARKVDEALACLERGLEVFGAIAIHYTLEAYAIARAPGSGA
jgi:DNA-binding GntR family transcriptional regulator